MEKISFPGGRGEMLAARFDHPAIDAQANATRQPTVLFAHCFTCTKDIYAASRISQKLCKWGMHVFRFDFTGLGASEGDFANTNFSSNTDDLVAAADFMRSRNQPPDILIGHSLGGAAVLATAQRIKEVKAVVTLAAPADVGHVVHHFASQYDEIIKEGEAEVCMVGRPFKVRKQFIEDVESVKLEQFVKLLRIALLVMHAPMDKTVGIENAAKIFSWARHPKSYVSLDDADHLISRKEDAEYAADVIHAWSSRFLA